MGEGAREEQKMSDGTFETSVRDAAEGKPVFTQEGLDLIKTFEGFRPDAYYDLDNKKKLGKLTVGYGFTDYDIPGLKPGYRIDRAKAEQLLPQLIDRKYANSVRDLVKVPVNNEQFSALTSLVYNIGPTNFKNSTLLKRLNVGDYDGAKLEFSKWVFAGGKPLDGLRKRREAEAALFGGDTETLVNILERQKFGPSMTTPVPEVPKFEETPATPAPKVSVMEEAMATPPTQVAQTPLGGAIPQVGIPTFQMTSPVEQTPADLQGVLSQVPQFDMSFLSAIESGLNRKGGLRV